MNQIQANVLQPNATVTVFLANTSTLATIYSDNNHTPQTNPFTADTSGNWSFFAGPGSYDVQFSGAGIPAPFKITGLGNSGVVPAYAVGGLPSSIPSNQGNLAVVTDAGGLWANSGTQWVPVDPFINVKDHNAKGDGVTDDTAAIQAALNEASRRGGGTVYLPAATYKITNILGMNSKITVLGDGPGTVILQTSDYTAGLQPNNGTADQTIRDLTLQGSYTHVTVPNGSTAISARTINSTAVAGGDMSDANFAGNRMIVENCNILNWGQNGMGVAAGSKIINNRFTNIYSEPIIIGGDNSLISGNYINGCGSWGIDNNASHTRIVNNLLYNVNQAVADPAILTDGGGIILANVNRNDGLSHIHCEGNTIDSSQSSGISVFSPNGGAQSLAYITIANNTLRNCYITPNTAVPYLGAAIDVSNAGLHADYPVHHILVANNIIENTFGHGIEVISCRYVDVVNNNVSNVRGTSAQQGGIGIRIFSHGTLTHTDVSVRGNTITNSADVSFYTNGILGNSTRINISGNSINSPLSTSASFPLMMQILNTTEFVCEANLIQGTNVYDGIALDGSTEGIVAGNYISGVRFGVIVRAANTGVAILNNDVRQSSAMFVESGLTAIIHNNTGFNPRGLLNVVGGQPAVPATGVAVQNTFGFDCWVAVTAPTNPAPDGITQIILTDPKGNPATLWPNSVGIVRSAYATTTVLLPTLYSITLTYTIAPTWVWFGN